MFQTGFIWFILAMALAPISVQSAGVFFVVPNNLLNTNGNDASRLPFSYLGQVRYQQVYDASQFSQLPPGGAFLTRIFLILDCSSTKSWLVTNLQVNVSTTKKGPDTLSPVFAENVGSDDIVRFGPAAYAPSLAGCGNSFAGEIEVKVPFFYDPMLGNAGAWDRSNALPNTIRRYSRLKICATIQLAPCANHIS